MQKFMQYIQSPLSLLPSLGSVCPFPIVQWNSTESKANSPKSLKALTTKSRHIRVLSVRIDWPNLDQDGLDEFAAQISQLTSLETLNLTIFVDWHMDTNIDRIYNSIAQLKGLTSLSLTFSQFSEDADNDFSS